MCETKEPCLQNYTGYIPMSETRLEKIKNIYYNGQKENKRISS